MSSPWPPVLQPWLGGLCDHFTRPTFARFVPLMLGLLLAQGRRTITNALAALPGGPAGHFSSYHRVFSRATWSLWPLGRLLATAVLATCPPDRPVRLVVDDTACGHRGDRVYGKGCHRDAVRSSRGRTVWRWGHRWVVLAVVGRLPFTRRRWALPVLCALYRPPALSEAEGRPHKTPLVLARQLTAAMIHWFPQRRFQLLGDGGFAGQELAVWCRRHDRHLALVSRLPRDARLYAPPPARRPGQKGRRRLKGDRLPSPQQVVTALGPAGLPETTVAWYGAQRRRIAYASGTGHWYRAGQGVVEIRWVYVQDRQGTHQPEYFYTTDLSLTARRIVSLYTARWPIETTFQELRTHLHLESPQQWTRRSVLRMVPCLLGLYTAVALAFGAHWRTHRPPPRQRAWYAKREPSFSDAIATIRREIWQEWVLPRTGHREAFEKLPPPLRQWLLDHLSQAA